MHVSRRPLLTSGNSRIGGDAAAGFCPTLAAPALEPLGVDLGRDGRPRCRWPGREHRSASRGRRGARPARCQQCQLRDDRSVYPRPLTVRERAFLPPSSRWTSTAPTAFVAKRRRRRSSADAGGCPSIDFLDPGLCLTGGGSTHRRAGRCSCGCGNGRHAGGRPVCSHEGTTCLSSMRKWPQMDLAGSSPITLPSTGSHWPGPVALPLMH